MTSKASSPASRKPSQGHRPRRRSRRHHRPNHPPPQRRLRPRLLLPDRPGRGELEPLPLRRRPLRLPRRDERRRPHRPLRAHPLGGLRRRAEAPHPARHLRALGRLLRGLLRQGPEGPHLIKNESRRLRGLRPLQPDLADRRLRARRARRTARHVSLGRPDDPAEHGRPARLSIRAASRTACQSACS